MVFTTEELKGKLYHFAKSLESSAKKDRVKFATLAETYELSEDEKKLAKILKEEDLIYEKIFKVLGHDWAKSCVNLSNTIMKQDYNNLMKEYLKER